MAWAYRLAGPRLVVPSCSRADVASRGAVCSRSWTQRPCCRSFLGTRCTPPAAAGEPSWGAHSTADPRCTAAAVLASAVVVATHSSRRSPSTEAVFCESAPSAPTKIAGDSAQQKALLRAVRNGDERRTLDLIRALPTINTPFAETGETMLWVACQEGRLGLVKGFLHMGADPRITDLNGTSCIAAAAQAGHVFVVEHLLEEPRSKPTADLVDILGFAAIHKATAMGNKDCLECLLDNGVDPQSATQNHRQEASLHIVLRPLASRQAGSESELRWELTRILLDYGADVACRDSQGDTPLHLCARQGDLTGIWQLLERTRNAEQLLQMRNTAGKTVLQEAREWGVDAEAAVRISALAQPVRNWLSENRLMVQLGFNCVVTAALFVVGRRYIQLPQGGK